MLWGKIEHKMRVGSGWAWALCNLNGVFNIELMKYLIFKKSLTTGERVP